MADIQQPPEIMEKLNLFVRNPTGYFLMSGSNGTGKTYAAMKIYERHTPYALPYKSDEHAIFIKQGILNIQYLDALKDRDLEQLAAKYINTKLLILDDLGSRPPTEAFLDFLFVILDQRWEEREKKGTIVTTNLNHADMRGKLGDAIASRIASGYIAAFSGKDRRLQNK